MASLEQHHSSNALACASADLSDYPAQQTFRKTHFLLAQRLSHTTKYSDGLILVTDASRDYR